MASNQEEVSVFRQILFRFENILFVAHSTNFLCDQDPDFGEANIELERFQNDAVLKAVLAQGVDLRQYSNEIEEQMHSTEAQCVAEFTKQAPKIDRIQTEIDVCDQMFERMHVTLQGFKAHLGAVSAEIHNLQVCFHYDFQSILRCGTDFYTYFLFDLSG
jgi:hypothetical protein